MRPVILFLKLDPFNLLLALAAKLVCHVIYWRAERVPERILLCFERLDVGALCDLDDWYRSEENMQATWKNVSNHLFRTINGTQKMLALQVDFKLCLLQWLSIQYERHQQFLHAVQIWRKKVQREPPYLAGTWLCFPKLRDQLGLEIAPLRLLSIFIWVDYFWLFTLGIMVACKQSWRLLTSGNQTFSHGKTFRWIWGGVAVSEMADGPGKLDFSFLASCGLIDPNNCLYLLPALPSISIQQWLSKKGVQALALQNLYSLLDFGERLQVLMQLWLTFVISFIRQFDNPLLPVKLAMMVNAFGWVPILRKLKPEVYIKSVSASWPESPEVAVVNALGIRSVIWFYSCNFFRWTTDVPAFRDRAVPASVYASRELWVWNQLARQWFQDRFVLGPVHSPNIRTVGPIMCGDASILDEDAEKVRIKSKIGQTPGSTYLAIFDVPPSNVTIRQLAFVGYPTCYDRNWQETLFKDITEILRTFGGLKLILKMKRHLSNAYCEYSDAFKALLDPLGAMMRQKRIIILGPETDPYIPVAASDLCVGVPFTSPVLVALSKGKPAIYYHPFGGVNFFHPTPLKPFVISGRQSLFSWIDQCLKNNPRSAPDAALERLRNTWLEPADNPAIRFAELLKNERFRESCPVAEVPIEVFGD